MRPAGPRGLVPRDPLEQHPERARSGSARTEYRSPLSSPCLDCGDRPVRADQNRSPASRSGTLTTGFHSLPIPLVAMAVSPSQPGTRCHPRRSRRPSACPWPGSLAPMSGRAPSERAADDRHGGETRRRRPDLDATDADDRHGGETRRRRPDLDATDADDRHGGETRRRRPDLDATDADDRHGGQPTRVTTPVARAVRASLASLAGSGSRTAWAREATAKVWARARSIAGWRAQQRQRLGVPGVVGEVGAQQLRSRASAGSVEASTWSTGSVGTPSRRSVPGVLPDSLGVGGDVEDVVGELEGACRRSRRSVAHRLDRRGVAAAEQRAVAGRRWRSATPVLSGDDPR